jgi:diketogulonate reductase-like aldo/keto reductase
MSRIQENLAAADLELSSAELDDLDAIAARFGVHGERYPESVQHTVNR